VRSGAPKPDVSSVEAFKRALLATKVVAFPGEGASGRYFVSVVERVGLTEAPDAAKALIAFISAPDAAATLRAKGVDPL
jgi:molybdate transport system substrate-binding protein